MKTEHILVIRFSAIGDVAMTVPVIYSLAKQYPNVRITMLSRPFARPFYENLAPNVSFMEADVKQEYHGIKGLNALYRRLTAKHFTAIADLHNVLRSNFLRLRFNLDNFKVAHIDKHRKGKHMLCSFNNKKLIQQPTAFQNYADVFAELGYPIQMNFTSIFPPGGGNLRLLPEHIIGKKQAFSQWIGIAPFAAHEGKIYPPRLMEQVIATLINHHPSARIFLFGGGKKETQQFEEWTQKYKNCINASGALSGIMQELILMSHLDVMISMDSANMHLASLTNIPVVSVWGATHPYAGFLGWKQSPDNAVQIDLPCRPCSIYGNKPCLRGDFSCMKNISPDLIVNRVEHILIQK
ncbi:MULTISPECIES: glycosyltransferase family 9 protein [Segatella]|jgi:ADP-heptose:LPS heptosyltransferase|uniref:Glycosyl transferase family 1 n=2 Tax=Segatella TaxID=2974251 RepID=A0AA37I2I3_SEGBR|nr:MULTISPECIES: glycosyltransferase family 9 protein [Segatella]MBQ3858003.1 glycosyltransferase family 9 protein [Prevotella sp.]EFI71855.1 putative ADP-heptose--LPS heptosyltransferase [Segatella baroniae B14]UKK77886.1 glycosyltransferase family 9 protein [Segatella baroniae B14]SEP99082.1 ADP-heptose:LPS heptosyltransferase [Segatella baroniae B14]GJG27840.1 glycosyl transferase family 1 [Segatella bryantii]